MAIQMSVTLRTARAAAIETSIGASPTLEIRTGAQPANCAAADTGTLLCSFALPADWLAAASAGSVSLTGTWAGTCSASGTAAHFRIKQAGTCHYQGSVSGPGGGGDMVISPSASLTNGQPFSVATFTHTELNA